MPGAEYFTECTIKISGQLMQDDFMDLLAEVVVDTSLHLPDMFTIAINDPELAWVDSNQLDVGKPVEIKIKTGGELGGLEGTLIKGEITALEPTFSAAGETTLLIRGYDKSHRLHRGKKTRTFLKQRDSDIVQRIAGEVGLSAQVDSTNIQYDYVLQNNQTNMEFLLARAQRIGYQVYSVDGRLYFKKGEFEHGQGPALSLGETLRSFTPRLNADHQADKIIVKGWDEKGKQAIVGQTTPNSSLNQGGVSKTGGDAAKTAFGGAEAVLVDRPIFTPAEAEALAKGLSNDLSRDFIQAEGACQGDPRVKAGWTVTISGVGRRFAGKYFVTSAIHAYSPGGYETTFSISGRQPNTLTQLLDSGNGHAPSMGLVQGVAIGLVTNLNDPEDLGRIKVKYPWLGEDIESDWIRIASPMAGAERGFYYLPEINDEVLLAFAHNDVHHPYVIGYLWSSKDKPPEPNSGVVSGGTVNQRIIKSRSGHVIILDDTDGSEQIIIRDKTGSNELVIDTASNSMSINVDQNLTIKTKGKIDIEATQDVSIKGQNVNVEGKQKSDIKAPQVGINGSAKVDVKGGMINLN